MSLRRLEAEAPDDLVPASKKRKTAQQKFQIIMVPLAREKLPSKKTNDRPQGSHLARGVGAGWGEQEEGCKGRCSCKAEHDGAVVWGESYELAAALPCFKKLPTCKI